MCRDGDGEHSAVGGDTGSYLGEARIGACRVKQPRDRDTDTAGCPLVEREAWVYLLGEPTIGEVWSARDLMMALGPSLSPACPCERYAARCYDSERCGQSGALHNGWVETEKEVEAR